MRELASRLTVPTASERNNRQTALELLPWNRGCTHHAGRAAPSLLHLRGASAAHDTRAARSQLPSVFSLVDDCTVAGLRQKFTEDDVQERAYGLGAILREANTRDVWLFTTPEQVRAMWPNLRRHLGRARARDGRGCSTSRTPIGLLLL